MVLVEEQHSSFVSTSIGEYVDPDKAESHIRESARQIAKSCRRTANELLDHAERLEAISKQSSPILSTSQIDKEEDHRMPDIEPTKFTKQLYPKAGKQQSYPRSHPQSQPLDLDDI